MTLSLDYISVLVQVTLFEAPVFWMFYRKLPVERVPAFDAQTDFGKAMRVAGLVALTNACIHPLYFFGFMSSGQAYLWSVFWGQIFAVFGDAFIQSWAARIPIERAIAASLVANLVSWQLTPLLTWALYY